MILLGNRSAVKPSSVGDLPLHRRNLYRQGVLIDPGMNARHRQRNLHQRNRRSKVLFHYHLWDLNLWDLRW